MHVQSKKSDRLEKAENSLATLREKLRLELAKAVQDLPGIAAIEAEVSEAIDSVEKIITAEAAKEAKNAATKAKKAAATAKKAAEELKATPCIVLKRPDMVGFRKDHILNRHKNGAGIPGKTEFPKEWNDNKIINEINDIANDPNAPGGVGPFDAPYKIAVIDGVEIRVDFYPDFYPDRDPPERHPLSGKVSTAYPTNTPANPE